MANPNSYVPGSESGLLEFLDDLESEGKQAKESWKDSRNWDRYVELSRGAHIYGPKERAIFRADIASPIVNRKTAMMTESEPVINITPLRPGYDATAEILTRVLLALGQRQHEQMMLEAIRTYIGAMGSGGCRIMWDKSEMYGLGDIVLPPVDPRLIQYDPAIVRSYEMDKASYIGPMLTLIPTYELKKRFPRQAKNIRPSNLVTLVGDESRRGGAWAGRSGSLKTATGLSRTRGKAGGRGGSEGAVPRTKVKAFWAADPAEDDNGPLWPGGRYFLRCGDGGQEDCIANFDEDPDYDTTANPYFDGLWDVEWLDNTPDLDHAWGRSEIGALRYLQETFNRIGNLIAKNGLRNGSPIIFAAQNALTPDKVAELKALEMLVIEYHQGHDIKREQPAIAPEIQLQLMNLVLTLSDMVTGLGDTGQMPTKGRQEVRSADQLEGLQNAGQTLVKADARRLEAFLQRVGKKKISRVLQYITDDRLMTYFGGGDTFQKFILERKQLVAEIQKFGAKKAMDAARKRGKDEMPSVEELADAMLTAVKGAWLDFDFRITPLSSLDITKVQRAMLKFQLASAMMIPRKDVLSEIRIDNPEEKLQEVAEEQAKMKMLGLEPPPAEAPKKGKKK